jgi:putative serine protease PepD
MDDDADDDPVLGGPPLPPDDRLWRHPSELRDHGLGGAPVASALASSSAGGASWSIVLVAALAGAALTFGLVAATGSLSRDVIERPVVEKVAMTPVVSTPMLDGDRSVVEVARRLRPSIVRLDVEVDGEVASGSGVIFRDDGMLLTSAHVVANSTSITAILSEGERIEGTLVGFDRLTDVAVVDLEGDGFPVAILGSADDLEVGAAAIAIGSPLGLEGGPSVTTGVVSAVGRRVEVEGREPLHGMIQTDAPIAPGSSGGALVDANGAVIGITSAVAADASGRFGFATPIDLAHRVAEQLMLNGRMVHGWIGVEGRDLAGDEVDPSGPTSGAVIRTVIPGGPAAAAGLEEGDVITAVGDTPVTSISALVVALRAHAPRDTVVLHYWRDEAPADAEVTLAERP